MLLESSDPSHVIRVTLSESSYPSHLIRVTVSKSSYPSHLIRVTVSESTLYERGSRSLPTTLSGPYPSKPSESLSYFIRVTRSELPYPSQPIQVTLPGSAICVLPYPSHPLSESPSIRVILYPSHPLSESPHPRHLCESPSPPPQRVRQRALRRRRLPAVRRPLSVSPSIRVILYPSHPIRVTPLPPAACPSAGATPSSAAPSATASIRGIL